jgi:hypothetical protein
MDVDLIGCSSNDRTLWQREGNRRPEVSQLSGWEIIFLVDNHLYRQAEVNNVKMSDLVK